VPCGPFRAVVVTTEAAALPLHPLHAAAVAQNARASPVRSARLGRGRTARAEVARFCMSRASTASVHLASLFARLGKRLVAEPSGAAPPVKKMRLATQQVPEKVRVMARHSSDGSCLFSAEVPCGPFRAVVVTTEAAALPLHPLHG